MLIFVGTSSIVVAAANATSAV